MGLFRDTYVPTAEYAEISKWWDGYLWVLRSIFRVFKCLRPVPDLRYGVRDIIEEKWKGD